MKSIPKGQAGYVRQQKVRRGWIALIMFAIPLLIFVSGILYTGSRKNILTVVAIVGILPASRFAVSWIMMLMQKEAPAEIVALTEERAGHLVHAYELTVTAYEGSMPLDAVVVCGGEVAAYSENGKAEQVEFMQKHIKKILSSNGFYAENVHIFKDRKAYAERISQLSADPEKYREGVKERPDDMEAGLNREDTVLLTICQISI